MLKSIQNSKRKLSIQDIVDIFGINLYHDTFPRMIPLRLRVKLSYVQHLKKVICKIERFANNHDFFKGLKDWFYYLRQKKNWREQVKKKNSHKMLWSWRNEYII